VTLTAVAREQANECEAWWRANRDAADLFSEELLSVIERLEIWGARKGHGPRL
jgi:hypothetical protein